MKNSAFAIALIGSVFCFGFAQAEETPHTLKDYVELCQSNPLCSALAVGDGMMFKLRKGARTRNILCKTHDTCATLLARGQSRRIDDVAAVLKPD